MKRFVMEYANYKKKVMKENDLMEEGVKKSNIEVIDRLLRFYQRDLITVDEVMQRIAQV